jgi:hypothetical protein
MGSAEQVDSDLDFFNGLDLDGLTEEIDKADHNNSETDLRLISGELSRRMEELAGLKLRCDESVQKLQMKEFG